jgi:calcineurin-like phosphoesterase family protein
MFSITCLQRRKHTNTIKGVKTTMKYYFTSDNHFGHKNIINYCNRPFNNIEHMHQEMIDRWNSVVNPEDIVFHLGDFVFRGKPKEFMKKLN